MSSRSGCIYEKLKKADRSAYYLYIVIYVDDILCIDENLGETMNKIAATYRMKEDSIGPPKPYLGASVMKWSLQDKPGASSECLATSS